MLNLSSLPLARSRSYPWILLTLTTALFVAACFLPAATIGDYGGGALSEGPVEHHTDSGLSCLLFGWLAFPNSLPGWSANWVLFAGMCFAGAGNWACAARSGLLATALSVSVPFSFSGDSFHAGYYLWVGSCAILGVGSLVGWRVRGRAVSVPSQTTPVADP